MKKAKKNQTSLDNHLVLLIAIVVGLITGYAGYKNGERQGCIDVLVAINSNLSDAQKLPIWDFCLAKDSDLQDFKKGMKAFYNK